MIAETRGGAGAAWRRLLAAGLLAALLWPAGVARGAEPKNYAYVLVQGRIADPLDRRPLSQATVRLTSPAGNFETVTDENGVFVFDRLPVAPYSLQVVTRDGRVVRSIEDPGQGSVNRADLQVRIGGGTGKVIDLTPKGDQVEISIRQPSARIRRIWKQLAIFLGGAGILALAH